MDCMLSDSNSRHYNRFHRVSRVIEYVIAGNCYDVISQTGNPHLDCVKVTRVQVTELENIDQSENYRRVRKVDRTEHAWCPSGNTCA